MTTDTTKETRRSDRIATWRDLAEDNRFVVYEMIRSRRWWRSCVSRAYYAVYSAATDELIRRGLSMPVGREGSSHAKIPEIVGNHLTGVSHSLRWRLAGIIRRLYRSRIMADYMPTALIEEAEAKLSVNLMSQALRILRDETWRRQTP